MSNSYQDVRFLVVDDIPTMRDAVIAQLITLGARHITEVGDGNAAKKTLAHRTEIHDPIQFIICDWNMPNFSGLDLLRFCRSDPAYKSVAFLLVTAEAQKEQVAEAIKAGVDNYVIKPFSRANLNEKIALVYAKRFNTQS